MTNLDSIFESRDTTLSTKVCLVKAMVFPVVIYGCESWTVKKAEHRRIDAFELWCWRRLLRVPRTARRSNQSILKEITPGCSLEGLMLKLKLQYFGHLMEELTHLKRPWCWEGLGVGIEGDNRGWDGWMASPTDSMDMSLSELWELVIDREPSMLLFMGSQRVGHDLATELNWAELKDTVGCHCWDMEVMPVGSMEVSTGQRPRISYNAQDSKELPHTKRQDHQGCTNFIYILKGKNMFWYLVG